MESLCFNSTKSVVKSKYDIDSLKGDARADKDILKRSLDELTIDANEMILELVAQNSIYRGKEFENTLKKFLEVQKAYKKVSKKDRDNFCWVMSLELPKNVSRVRNSAIGTLLIDLSDGMDLDLAVTKFEKVVAPHNYKRPTALVTPRMVQQAKEKLEEMGLLESLNRRYANEQDLNINDVLFTNRISPVVDVFDEISRDAVVNPRTYSKVDEVTIEDFIKNVLPTAKGLEVLVENNHMKNFVSLLTGDNDKSLSLFKWGNNFSWNYTGGITDSIKERVKAAGGRVEGDLRVSLSWFNYDDLDLSVKEPDGNVIYYGRKSGHTSSGTLDVDMNAGGRNSRSAVENIIYSDRRRMKDGDYKIIVTNFAKRESIDTGYIVQVEFDGEVYDFESRKSPVDRGNNLVITVNYSKANGFSIKGDAKSNVVSKDKWGIKTNQFVRVTKFMLSPNHWGTATGNKHFFFMLDGCISDEKPRPFFNEFLKQEFNENRKVFEIMGSKVKIEDTDNQLSGLGFSETKDDHLYVKVEGKTSRVIKVKF